MRRPAVACAAIVMLVACTSAGSTPKAASVVHHHAGHDAPIFGGQYSVADALKLPIPSEADTRALRTLSEGVLPTTEEVARASAEMSDITAHPDITPGDAAEVARISADLAAARTAVERWPTTGAAAKAGFGLASRFLPGIGAHWIDWSRVDQPFDQPFDPAQPSMLLFDASVRPRLVGLSYYTQSTGEPRAFTAAGAHWHRHFGLCIVHGVLVAEGITERSACAGGRGTLLPGRDLWMLHLWVVPGHENPLGTYAALNSSLCSSEAPCTPNGSIPSGAAPDASPAPSGSDHIHMDYARPRAHPTVGGDHAWKVNPLVVEVSEFARSAKPTTAQRLRAATLVKETLTTLRRFRTLESARAAGYIPMPDDPIHWYQPSYLADGRVLDPAAPEFLVYIDPDQPTQQLRSDDVASIGRRVVVGAMYWMSDATAHGPQVGGPQTVWHFHEWSPGISCGDASGFPLASPVDGRCATGVPIPRSAEMLHVWGVPAPNGRFSTSMEFLANPTKVLERGYLR